MANVMEDHFNGECHDSFDHAVRDSHDANHDEDFHTNVEWYRRGNELNEVDHHFDEKHLLFEFPTSLYQNCSL